MRLLVFLVIVVLFTSCAPKNCYMCITTTEVGYDLSTATFDTVMKCDFTSKDANTYQTAHTINGPALTSAGATPCTTCTTAACRCIIPTK